MFNNNSDNFFISLFTTPFINLMELLEYIFYVHIYPLWTGKPVAIGWNPKLVREGTFGFWNPSVSIDFPYSHFEAFKDLSQHELKMFGVERTKSGHYRRIITPQLYYANPEKVKVMNELAFKSYYNNIAFKEEEYRKQITLDPFKSITYYNQWKWNNYELFSYNIQMKIKFLWFDNIDIIEVLCSFIFFLVLGLLYFIFYHLYKLNIKLENAELLLNENGLSLYPNESELSGKQMENAWREGGMISETFDLGIEIDYCLYEGSLISMELLTLMFCGYISFCFYSFFYNYIYLFYVVNEELITYIFVYLFFIMSIYYWFKMKYERKKAIHRWVELDYYFSHFLNHYFRTLSWLNLYKLVSDAPLYGYVLVYTLSMIWIYFVCDSKDYFMGWNQEYRIDIYKRQTNMHFWWPRILMNQTWHHFYITLMKPLHTKIIYIFLFFFLPFLYIFLFLVYFQNKIHVYINNKYFFWNSKKYTIDEIKEQWKKDRKYNIIEEKREKDSKGRGLIIL